MQMQLVDWIWIVIVIHGLVVALALVLYGLHWLDSTIVPPLRQLFTTLRFWGRTTQRVRDIRAIGQHARHEMHRLYTDYLAQVDAQKRR